MPSRLVWLASVLEQMLTSVSMTYLVCEVNNHPIFPLLYSFKFNPSVFRSS